MKITQEIYSKVENSYGRYYEPLTGVPAHKITQDVLSEKKPEEQLIIIERYCGSLTGKKLLEVGSGFGIFVTASRQKNIESHGVEPDGEGFGDSFAISQKILEDNGIDKGIIKTGVGEKLPFEKDSFDVVYSTNVLEHVQSPKDFVSEAIRVCKPGGYVQIVFPNYGSFYDGHYSSFYIPYQPKWLWKLFIRVFHKKDVSYVDTLRTEMNYFSVRKILKPYLKRGAVAEITYGEEIFKERMQGINFSTWAGLEKVKRWLELVKKTGLLKVAIWTLVATKSYSPLIITLRKNE